MKEISINHIMSVALSYDAILGEKMTFSKHWKRLPILYSKT